MARKMKEEAAAASSVICQCTEALDKSSRRERERERGQKEIEREVE